MKKDQLGNDMIDPWMGTTSNIQDDYFKRKRKIISAEQTRNGVKVYLEIGNRKCTALSESSDLCFQTANAAAEFLAAKTSKHSLLQSFSIYQVNCSTGLAVDENPPANAKYVRIGILLVICLSAVLFIIIQTQRKRTAGITWFPEGFLRTNSGTRRRSRRRGPEGQELRNLSKNPSIPGMEIDPNVHHEHMPQWSDDESDMPQPKRFRGNDLRYSSDHTAIMDYEKAEPRWTQQHLEAADIRPPSMLTRPQGNEHADTNARGPCGITPIMVAAVRDGGIDTWIDEDEDNGAGAYLYSGFGGPRSGIECDNG